MMPDDGMLDDDRAPANSLTVRPTHWRRCRLRQLHGPMPFTFDGWFINGGRAIPGGGKSKNIKAPPTTWRSCNTAPVSVGLSN